MTHQHLYTFFATNDQLLLKYDDDVDDLEMLKSIRDNNLPHVNTKFHCSGPLFNLGTPLYKELGYHCIKHKLPKCHLVGIGKGILKICQKHIHIPGLHCYYFTVIPDLVQ